MELHTLYFNTYNKVLNEKSDWYKSRLIDNKAEYRTFNKTSNESLTLLTNYVEKLTIEENKNRFMELFSVFNSRYSEYNVKHEELIIKNELKTTFFENELSSTMSYEKLITTLAEYSAINESSRIIQNGYNYYQLIYNEDLINDEFIFCSNDHIKNDKFYNLRDKINPPLIDPSIDYTSENIIKSDEKQTFETSNYIEDNPNIDEINSKEVIIKLGGIEFTLLEFALYNRLWSDFVSDEKMVFRELYDKIMMDFNDPFNDIIKGKRYDSTSFYGALKDNNPDDNDEFNQCTTLDKILRLLASTKNINFVKYIKQRKRVLKDKNRCK